MSTTQPSATGSTPLDISTRLDSLPLGRKHRKVLVGSGIGWALDAMDVGLISFIVAALAQQWQLTKGESGLFVSVGFVGMAIGAGLGGLLADRLGRKHVFALTLLIYGLATGASALAGGLGVLLVLRFFVGLGLGAELPVASTYVSEFAPARIRGRLIVILEAFWAVGWTAAAVIGYFVVPASDNGWRWAFAIGAVPALYALVVRWAMPESPRWLASRGRLAEAEAIVADFEANSPAPLEAPPVRATQAAGNTTPHRHDCVRSPQGLVVARVQGAHGSDLGGLAVREFRLLRRLYLDPLHPCRCRFLPGPLLRLHPDHHPRPAARIRGGRLAH